MKWRSEVSLSFSREEKVPIDGMIVEGSSSLNTSALTGESLPRDAKSRGRDYQRLHLI